ncbi:hypothetical protein DICPUDRAFT_158314 [Dictyostelium purpureum]|uniref:Uncharacterized protein n=1 Tax=Dictyostelium purpureum TaxID=5786 RepID=F1A1A8_DICPU|nr:uncharacterized protein DICPUDRAFT_158314 [Dictyostelium purpureum]EGC30021.1 hypothetical protein DICPUDRAFT_158314 [Dictyostelium purpureum]|eukprot:XP_003293448.1 hypothetical protein DICPUDRAFT_158314 [Dictyostelium purpureum]
MNSQVNRIMWSSDFIYSNKWTATSLGKTTYLEKDNGLSMTRNLYEPTASFFSQQILFLIFFIVLFYFTCC